MEDNEFKVYHRTQKAEMRPYRQGEILSPEVSISMQDMKAGSPKPGDMIARNPADHDDQWLVSASYFAANFEPRTSEQGARGPTANHGHGPMDFTPGPHSTSNP